MPGDLIERMARGVLETQTFQMFAHRSERVGWTFEHVFSGRRQVEMCGSGRVVAVAVRVAENGEDETHWGWLDTGKERPEMIWPSYLLLCICFQAEEGMMDRVRRGFGRPVRLIVEASVAPIPMPEVTDDAQP